MDEPLTITDALVIPASDLSYEYSRSGGPGGQHVNTADTRVRLRFALDRCTVLSEAITQRVRGAYPGRLNAAGELTLTCDRNRSRHRNQLEVRERLCTMLRDHLRPPAKRKPTRPSRASKERRIVGKKRRGSVKKGRGRVSHGED